MQEREEGRKDGRERKKIIFPNPADLSMSESQGPGKLPCLR